MTDEITKLERVVAELRGALGTERAKYEGAVSAIPVVTAKLQAEVERLARERDAARENALSAMQERDGLLVKLGKVADLVKGCPDANALARRIKEIIGVCPSCAVLGRIAGTPCTHLGPVGSAS